MASCAHLPAATAPIRASALGAVIEPGAAERWAVEEARPMRRKHVCYIRSLHFSVRQWEDNITVFPAAHERSRPSGCLFEQSSKTAMAIEYLPTATDGDRRHLRHGRSGAELMP